MKAITLRNIPRAIADMIEVQAKLNGTSLSRTVIDLLARAVESPEPRRRRYHDLDHLAGRWSREEADAFDAALADQRVMHREGTL
jgi:hypothetical protein